MECPYCEGEISETAKKCKHCGEWLEGDKKTQPKAKSLSQILSDYWIVILIIGIIIRNVLTSKESTENIIEDISDDIFVDNLEIKGLKSDFLNEIQAVSGDSFSLFPDSQNECIVTNIKDFTESVNNTKSGDFIHGIKCKKNIEKNQVTGKKVAYLFNNSYSKVPENAGSEYVFDKKVIDINFQNLEKYLDHENLKNGSIIYFSFMFTDAPNNTAKKPGKNNNYEFVINQEDVVKYKKIGAENIYYSSKRHFLDFKDIGIEPVVTFQTGCFINGESTNIYKCHDVGDVLLKIKEIYKNEYNITGKHENLILLKNFGIYDKRFSGDDKVDTLYLLSNGEFEIGYEWESKYLGALIQKIKHQYGWDQGVSDLYHLSEFSVKNAERYQRDDKYETFWSDAIKTLQKELHICEDSTIFVIGLDEAETFKKIAKQIYPNIFAPCNVIFK